MVKPATKPVSTSAPDERHEVLASIPLTEDVIEYTIACTLALAPPEVPPDLRQNIALKTSQQVRRVFGGDRVYISIRAGEGHSSRNQAIKRDYLAGEHIHLLERRYGLKRTRIWEIIKS